MRWRTIDEVKAGKGDSICANVACGRTEGLEGMEVVFNYVEDNKAKTVLVKCVLCEKCGRKMHRARGSQRERKRSLSGDKHKDDEKERQHRHHRAHERSTGHEKKRRRKEYEEDDDSERRKREAAAASRPSKASSE